MALIAANIGLQASGTAANAADSGALIVKTASGQVRGVARAGGGAEFLGIPYAQPPVGELRWHEPLPVKPWSGIRDAMAFGAPCAQPDLGEWNRHEFETGKEDCLFLNVITSVWPAQKPLPVMFWIHGGANAGGTASSALYKDGTLPKHGVILVTVNYRLSIFGFYAHPELTRESAHASSGNYGLEDQILALRWVRDNIARFGGDPKNITVFGQSAGAQDTSLLMISNAKDLFQKAIAQSGAAFMAQTPSLHGAEQAGVEFAQQMKAPSGADTIKYLRGLSAEELLKPVMNPDLSRHPRVGPDVDGWVIPEQPALAFVSGREAAIPLLLGVTTREFGSNDSPEQLRKKIQEQAGNLAELVFKVYGLSDGSDGTSDPVYGTASDQLAADVVFHCPGTTQAAWHQAAHHPTYEYLLNHPIPGQEAKGTVHSADLPYVFGYYPKSGGIAGNFGEADFKLTELVETYWTNFARTGDPNGPGVIPWPQSKGGEGYLEFLPDGTAVVRNAKLRGPQCDVYRQILAARMKDEGRR